MEGCPRPGLDVHPKSAPVIKMWKEAREWELASVRAAGYTSRLP